MRKKKGHLFSLLLVYNKFPQTYGIKSLPFYYACDFVGQKFEKEYKGVSSSLHCDVCSLWRKTQGRRWLTGWSVAPSEGCLACLPFEADVFRNYSWCGQLVDRHWPLPLHGAVWAFSQHGGWVSRVSGPNKHSKATLPSMVKLLKSHSVTSTMITSLPNSMGGNLDPSLSEGDVRVIFQEAHVERKRCCKQFWKIPSTPALTG